MLEVRCRFGCPTNAKVIVGFCVDPGVGTKTEVAFRAGLDGTPSRPREPLTDSPELEGPEPVGVGVGTDASLLPRRGRVGRALRKNPLF